MMSDRRGKGMGGGHRSRGNDEWITPKHIIDAFPPFDMDPCAAVDQPWPTAKLMVHRGGLEHWWHGQVWLNPPYGRETGRWLEKLAAHDPGGIALIFARTETAMFVEHVWGKASALLFLHGRLWFHHVNGDRAKANSGAPSVLVAYGDQATKMLCESNLEGSLVHGWWDRKR